MNEPEKEIKLGHWTANNIKPIKKEIWLSNSYVLNSIPIPTRKRCSDEDILSPK